LQERQIRNAAYTVERWAAEALQQVPMNFRTERNSEVLQSGIRNSNVKISAFSWSGIVADDKSSFPKGSRKIQLNFI